MYQFSMVAPQLDIISIQTDLEPLCELRPNIALSAFEKAPPLWSLDIYCSEEEDAVFLTHFLENCSLRHPFTKKHLPKTDWVAMSLEDLPPVRAGRFVVYGQHDKHKVRAGEISLHIEASAAFGTGHHQTTAGCLLALDQLLKTHTFKNALDLGTGTGVLGIALAKTQKSNIIASEIDARSVVIARENARLNGVKMNVFCEGNPQKLPHRGSSYDLIFANILAPVLVSLAPQIRILSHGGTVAVLSGILNWQARKILGIYKAQGFYKKEHIIIGDWSTLILEKR